MAGTLVANTINTDTGLFSTNNAYTGIAKAWVNFVGTTGAINQSFNVSSLTRNSTGNYTLNFATAMANANYVVAGSTVGATSNTASIISGNNSAGTTSAFTFLTLNSSSQSVQDSAGSLGIAVFGS